MGLYEKLVENSKSDIYPMHMPGHKRNPDWNMCNPYDIDITEIDGFDNLHAPTGLIADIEAKASHLYKTKATYILINGSTAGILTGVSACCNPGDRILVSRGSHICVYHAAALRQLRVEAVAPQSDVYDISKGITALQVQEAFDLYPDIKMVVLTSPTYEGVFSEVREISEITHKNGAVLMVDGAHGAHLEFMCEHGQKLYSSAVQCGADIVVHSIHKTLPAFTQTALLHICSDRVSMHKIRYYLDIYQTSSPSYILMAGVGRCIDYLYEKAKQDFEVYICRIKKLYTSLHVMNNLEIIDDPCRDIGKLVIYTGKSNISGTELYRILLDRYHIQPEMAASEYVLCMTSVSDTEEGFMRLEKALLETDKELGEYIEADIEHKEKNTARETSGKAKKHLSLPKKIYEPYQTETMETKEMHLYDAVGHISADYIYIYPPGIALLVPGEQIDEDLIQTVKQAAAKGLKINKEYIQCAAILA